VPGDGDRPAQQAAAATRAARGPEPAPGPTTATGTDATPAQDPDAEPEETVRIGVISDTHGMLRPEVFDVFSEVDHILHAGDIGRAEILVELGALAPVTAVYGNTDPFDVRQACPQVARTELEGLRVVVTHGDQFGSPKPEALREAFPETELIVFGHTHAPFLELYDYLVTVMNPGSAGAARFGTPPSVGIVDVEAGIPPRGRIVALDGRAWRRGTGKGR
jgi:putative phosphoesterase